jgi:hypothetical protein
MSCLAPTPSSSAARCHGPTASAGASAGTAENSDWKRAIAAAIAAASAPVAVFSATDQGYSLRPRAVLQVTAKRIDDRLRLPIEPRPGDLGDVDIAEEQLVAAHPILLERQP